MDNETFKCKMSRYSMAFCGEISAAKNTRTKKYSIWQYAEREDFQIKTTQKQGRHLYQTGRTRQHNTLTHTEYMEQPSALSSYYRKLPAQGNRLIGSAVFPVLASINDWPIVRLILSSPSSYRSCTWNQHIITRNANTYWSSQENEGMFTFIKSISPDMGSLSLPALGLNCHQDKIRPSIYEQ
jgi:hypothetical protein